MVLQRLGDFLSLELFSDWSLFVLQRFPWRCPRIIIYNSSGQSVLWFVSLGWFLAQREEPLQHNWNEKRFCVCALLLLGKKDIAGKIIAAPPFGEDRWNSLQLVCAESGSKLDATLQWIRKQRWNRAKATLDLFKRCNCNLCQNNNKTSGI